MMEEKEKLILAIQKELPKATINVLVFVFKYLTS